VLGILRLLNKNCYAPSVKIGMLPGFHNVSAWQSALVYKCVRRYTEQLHMIFQTNAQIARVSCFEYINIPFYIRWKYFFVVHIWLSTSNIWYHNKYLRSIHNSSCWTHLSAVVLQACYFILRSMKSRSAAVHSHRKCGFCFRSH